VSCSWNCVPFSWQERDETNFQPFPTVRYVLCILTDPCADFNRLHTEGVDWNLKSPSFS
jgi:hypothetical protein